MNTQRLFLGTNWKMHKTVREATDYTRRLLELLDSVPIPERIQLFLIPPFTAIAAVKKVSRGRFWVGAQNMHSEEWGPYTGEISAPMLQELGVDLVELGHAERRRSFNETDAAINRKVHLALAHGLRPLVCIGDSAEEKSSGVEREALTRQIKIALHGVSKPQASALIIAYEPFWAIGESGTAADAEWIRSMGVHVRSVLASLFGSETGQGIPVIYGGSLNESNAAQILTGTGTDGLFIGRAAWNPDSFFRLISACSESATESGAQTLQPMSPKGAKMS
jgi:triosephosphate isomerase